MKICEVTDANIGLFEQYIPTRYAGALRMRKDHMVFGLYDGTGEGTRAIGAAVVYVYDGTAEILSLTYNDDVPDGIPEKALTDLILEQDWDLYRILYTSGGTKEELMSYDLVMMDIGYIPLPGEVQRYHATLTDIMFSQKDSIAAYAKRTSSKRYLRGRELSQRQLYHYNLKFPLTAYECRPDNENLSCFLLKNDMPEAGIEVIDHGDGKLEFSWMNKGELNSIDTMDMILHLLSEVFYSYDTSTEVVICPYQDEVIHLMERFGFEPDPNGNDTHMYTLYI